MKKLITFFWAGISLALLLPNMALAQQTNPNIKGILGKTGQEAFGTTRPRSVFDIIAQFIDIALGFIGVIMLIMFLYGGYLWLTAAGNDDQVSSAKTIIRNAVIGLIIVLSAYTLSFFVTEQLFDATGAGDTGPSPEAQLF